MPDSKKPTPSKTPEGIVDALLAHFNTMDVDVMLGLFGPNAISVTAQGECLRGRQAIKEEMERFYSLQLPLQAVSRHVFVAGDIASVILDWSIAGKSAAGDEVRVGGSANDVYQRCADGCWRILIDNPLGTQIRQ
ncbi:uncharacterized protein (TIGR02246 family) [Panacagrimonas perspica]|uniref:Uncharacterized protein (TIGR02246 family) n=1 Tax=Panacagrimonas perspica TaxID=381431 RepID=A0A4S3KCC5_9GAMM|nr:nuclear transport factor 2 family protein [Panacagrimonas perspica]TDU32657.1 uncharacterized protein (TIGR02246 family) [Panacagrimonas perspica]THD05544.1 hypothetical protein B1810_02160 [Panacagrimonas perspica]